MFFKYLIFLSVILVSVGAVAAEEMQLPDSKTITDWETFSKSIDSLDKANENSGEAYMISGAAVAIGGGIISHQSTDPLTNLTLSLIQSAGLAGIGYGAGLYYLSTPDQMFRDTLQLQTDLTVEQKNSMTRNYLSLKKDSERKKRIISAITYGVVAAFNTYNALQATDNSLKTAYWALVGVNFALSMSFTF